MTPIDRLIEASRKSPKRIAVVGCSMEDVWIHGDLLPSQDGVQKFVEHRRLSTPGGAAGAARQLCRWNAEVVLLSALAPGRSEAWNQINSLYWYESRRMPEKHRFLDAQGRIVWRHDREHGYGMDGNLMAEQRKRALEHLTIGLDAVLISDYDKGFLTEEMIRKVIDWCNERKVPVVADAKREPEVYAGSVIKCNEDWRQRHRCISIGAEAVVSTRGALSPIFFGPGPDATYGLPDLRPVTCVNHVGAGDCFSAHLTLALAHGLSLEDAAAVAHSAGRVYVQHPHGRPPWPHEVRRDMDSFAGKILTGGVAALKGENDSSGHTPAQSTLHALRKSIPGKLVFTNGVFRVPHAGHARLFQWAKAQGDVLVVGLNSDASAGRIREGKAMLNEAERSAILAAQEAVDWVVVFEEDDPTETVKALRPDILVKGAEYLAQKVPGSDIVSDVRFAPMVPAVRPARLIPAGIA